MKQLHYATRGGLLFGCAVLAGLSCIGIRKIQASVRVPGERPLSERVGHGPAVRPDKGESGLTNPVKNPEVIPTRALSDSFSQQLQGMRTIPFQDVGNVLQNDIAGLLGDLRLGMLKDPVKNLGRLVIALDQLLLDVEIATKAAQEFPKIVRCSKMKEELRKNDPMCKSVKSDVTRAQVVGRALGRLRLMLKPLLDDFFIGYVDQSGKQQPGLAFIMLDMVQQPGQKGQLEKIIGPMRAIENILADLQKLLNVNE